MRDRKGNFVKNTVTNRDFQNFSRQGIWTLRDSDYDLSSGVANYDPFLNYVEFIFKFEESNNLTFANSINKPIWARKSEAFGKAGKYAGYGNITNAISKFGNSCYTNGDFGSTSGDQGFEKIFIFGAEGNDRTANGALNFLGPRGLVQIGNNDFTLECWMYLTNLNMGSAEIFNIYGRADSNFSSSSGTINNGAGVMLRHNNDGRIVLCNPYHINQNLSTTTNPVLTTNSWQHIALVRKNLVLKVFVDGVEVLLSNSYKYRWSDTYMALLGSGTTLGTLFADEVRFTNQIARYWSNFSPPTQEFYAPVLSTNKSFVLNFDEEDKEILNPIIKDSANKSIWIGSSSGIIKSTLNGIFAVTIASPGVFTKTEHGLQAGDTVTFSTTGSLPTGLTAGTTYFVISTGLTANAFRVSATLNGSAINTSGTQSGIHSLTVTSSIQPVARFGNSLYSSSHGSFFYLSPDIVPQTSDFNLSFWMKSMASNGNYGGSNGIDEGGFLFNLNQNMSLRLAGDSYADKGGTFSPNKGRLRFYVNNILTARTSINSILRDNWNHIHISRNQNDYTVFINGNQSATGKEFGPVTMPASVKWQAMAYGNSTFVAISGSDAVSTVSATSADGVNWTQRTLPASAWWSDVVYGDKFVAIAGGGSWSGSLATTTAATSSDGIIWTTTTMPASATWSAIAYGNGTYVAISGGAANSNIAAYSSDGINWTQSTLPSSTTWTSIAYGNGVFVAISRGTIAATSTNGVTWTQRTLPSNSGWSSITYGDKFLIVSSGGGMGGGNNVSATSPDGITWTSRTLPFSGWWLKTSYGNGTYIITGTIAKSDTGVEATGLYGSDGINWNLLSMPSGDRWGVVAFGNNTFVGTVKGNTPTWNGASSSASTAGFISNIKRSISRQYLMLGCYRGLVDENTVATSTDGLSQRFNGYLEDFVLNKAQGLTTVSVPDVAAQPPRVLY